MKLSNKKGDFKPCPEFVGRAVCVDVTPPEIKQTEFGPKEKFRLVFEIDLLDGENENRPHCVWSSGFTTSLNEKAAFRKFLKGWFGRDLTAQELEEFDTESLLSKPAFVVVTHSAAENDPSVIYANITACTPHKVGEPLKPSGKFTRKKDRKDKPAAPAAGSASSYRAAEQPKADAPESGREDWMKTKVHVGKHVNVELGDLDGDAVAKLIAHWLPVFEKNPKPTADDRRLSAALKLAAEALATPAPAPEY